jgi:hypothetical protein
MLKIYATVWLILLLNAFADDRLEHESEEIFSSEKHHPRQPVLEIFTLLKLFFFSPKSDE